MSNQETVRKGLSVKDLVTTGIFTALLFIFTMVGGVFFATNPVLTFYMPAGSALLCGLIYLLMVAKVQKRWSLTIMGVLIVVCICICFTVSDTGEAPCPVQPFSESSDSTEQVKKSNCSGYQPPFAVKKTVQISLHRFRLLVSVL